MTPPGLASIEPLRAVEGGRIALRGHGLSGGDFLPTVTIGGAVARVSFASPERIIVIVPSALDGGPTPVRISDRPGETAFVSIGSVWAAGLHQVDNPVFDADGNLFVTYSGSRGQSTPVSVFRVTTPGTREPFVTGIVNATSMAVGPDGKLYVSSRFEGAVYRVQDDGTHDVIATDLGVACGLAFDSDGWLYVGDRGGTVFRVRDGAVSRFATLPSSIAAFHLAMSPNDELYVAVPTLAPYDRVYRIDRKGEVTTLPTPFGRPQGLAFDSEGTLHVADALAGASGVYRLRSPEAAPELVVAGNALVGLAFSARGDLVVASNESAYRFAANHDV